MDSMDIAGCCILNGELITGQDIKKLAPWTTNNNTSCKTAQNSHVFIVFGNDYPNVKTSEEHISFNLLPSFENDTGMNATISIDDQNICIENDFWGTHSIYYIVRKNYFFFSTSIKYLLAIIPQDIEYDTKSLISLCSLGFIYDEDGTIYQGIHRLPKNSTIRSTASGVLIKKKPQEDCCSFSSINEAADALSETFDAVFSDATSALGKKAVLLSGGMDSSTIAIYAASLHPGLTAITFKSGSNLEDVAYAKRLADVLNLHHVEFSFQTKLINHLPEYLRCVETIEPSGIFSPLGGLAYYLLIQHTSKLDIDIVYPGEGSDEIFGGYYWPFTHPLGFADRLKEATKGTLYESVIQKRFPEPENRDTYRLAAYDFLQGTALTNYHLSCVDQVARSFGLRNYPVFMDARIFTVVRRMKLEWLCDSQKTKIILRRLLMPFLEKHNLLGLANRKKLAMPSLIPPCAIKDLRDFITPIYKEKTHPYADILGNDPLNLFMFDTLHTFLTTAPLCDFNPDTWESALARMEKQHEPLVSW